MYSAISNAIGSCKAVVKIIDIMYLCMLGISLSTVFVFCFSIYVNIWGSFLPTSFYLYPFCGLILFVYKRITS